MYLFTEVKEKLDTITSIWNCYFLKEKYCQNQINFNEEVKTNYYGDILHYFVDTIKSIRFYLEKKSTTKDYTEDILLKIGLLQIMYIQQDLVDEIHLIFGLQRSNGDSKKLIRKTRNELAGHPVSRDLNKKLISSVLWDYNCGLGSIKYTIYSCDNNFEALDKEQSVDKLIKYHIEYIIQNFNRILKKEREVLKRYKRKLEQLNDMVSCSKCTESEIIEFAISHFNSFFEGTYFSSEAMKKTVLLINENTRYKEFYDCFIDSIVDSLKYKLNDIDSCLSSKEQPVTKIEQYEIDTTSDFDIITKSNVENGEEDRIKTIKRCFSKLHDSSYNISCRTLERVFAEEQKLLALVRDLSDFEFDSIEYNISFELLRKELVLKRCIEN